MTPLRTHLLLAASCLLISACGQEPSGGSPALAEDCTEPGEICGSSGPCCGGLTCDESVEPPVCIDPAAPIPTAEETPWADCTPAGGICGSSGPCCGGSTCDESVEPPVCAPQG